MYNTESPAGTFVKLWITVAVCVGFLVLSCLVFQSEILRLGKAIYPYMDIL